jgi:hypothetical protein
MTEERISHFSGQDFEFYSTCAQVQMHLLVLVLVRSTIRSEDSVINESDRKNSKKVHFMAHLFDVSYPTNSTHDSQPINDYGVGFHS